MAVTKLEWIGTLSLREVAAKCAVHGVPLTMASMSPYEVGDILEYKSKRRTERLVVVKEISMKTHISNVRRCGQRTGPESFQNCAGFYEVRGD